MFSKLFSKSSIKLLAIFLGTILVMFFLTHVPDVQAGTINIRNDDGKVTTWGWWLINIFAPFFVTFELFKLGLGLFLLPLLIFGENIGFEFILGAWENLTIMWPGLLGWGLFFLASKS